MNLWTITIVERDDQVTAVCRDVLEDRETYKCDYRTGDFDSRDELLGELFMRISENFDKGE
jgi:hypothetical protein